MELDNIRERVAANMDGDIGIVESDDEHFPDFKFASPEYARCPTYPISSFST